MRMAPSQKGAEIVERLREVLTKADDSTFGAKIDFELVDVADGFCAKEFQEALKQKVISSSKEIFDGEEPLFVGSGGSIPFMEVMSNEFPAAQFMLTGVLFADSNAHAANENIRLGFTAKLTSFLTLVISKL